MTGSGVSFQSTGPKISLCRHPLSVLPVVRMELSDRYSGKTGTTTNRTGNRSSEDRSVCCMMYEGLHIAHLPPTTRVSLMPRLGSGNTTAPSVWGAAFREEGPTGRTHFASLFQLESGGVTGRLRSLRSGLALVEQKRKSADFLRREQARCAYQDGHSQQTQSLRLPTSVDDLDIFADISIRLLPQAVG